MLVVAGLGRHRRDRVGGHVRRVDDQYVDPAPQLARQRRRTGRPRGRARAAGCAGRRRPPPGRRRRRTPRGRDGRRAARRRGRRCRSTGRPRCAPARPALRCQVAPAARLRRRGTKTPGCTTIRIPANSAQPSICSSGRPSTRSPTIRSSSSGAAPAATSSAASSSANTQPGLPQARRRSRARSLHCSERLGLERVTVSAWPDVFAPARLGPVELRNRTVKAATFEGRTPQGQVTDDLIEYHLAASPAAGSA